MGADDRRAHVHHRRHGLAPQREDFGEDFELPPDRAYSETCAGIASVMLCWRLLLATGEARYADLAERTLYNVVATSPALDGRAFFYANPLHQRVPGEPPAPDARQRARVVEHARAVVQRRLLPDQHRPHAREPRRLRGDGRRTAACRSTSSPPATIRDGALALRVETGYPWSGEVVVRVRASDDRPRTLALRVPAWATGRDARRPARRARLRAPSSGSGGRATSCGWNSRWRRAGRSPTRAWTPSAAASPPSAARSSTAWSPPTRSTTTLDGVAVDTSAPPVERPLGEEAGGGVGLTAPGEALDVHHAGAWPYDGGGRAERTPARLAFVPYHAWGNRGPSTMRVWTPVAVSVERRAAVRTSQAARAGGAVL